MITEGRRQKGNREQPPRKGQREGSGVAKKKKKMEKGTEKNEKRIKKDMLERTNEIKENEKGDRKGR